MKKIAVVLMNLGGPDSLEAVEPFLYHLFSDPDIIQVPFGRHFQKWLARLISKRRSPSVIEKYKMIGGSSPINHWTEKQRYLLEKELKKENYDATVFTAMRYWHPFIKETQDKINKEKYDLLVLLPLYPQFSYTTTGSSLKEWQKHYQKKNISSLYIVHNFYQNKSYLKTINQHIDKALKKSTAPNKTHLVFSAHGLPKKLVTKGDPYQKEIEETVHLVMNNRKKKHSYSICYQSKVTFVEWLRPYLKDELKSLAEAGKKSLVIIPISFVSDHIETSHELDIEYREIADSYNFTDYIVTEGFNDSPYFIQTLKEITLNAISKKS